MYCLCRLHSKQNNRFGIWTDISVDKVKWFNDWKIDFKNKLHCWASMWNDTLKKFFKKTLPTCTFLKTDYGINNPICRNYVCFIFVFSCIYFSFNHVLQLFQILHKQVGYESHYIIQPIKVNGKMMKRVCVAIELLNGWYSTSFNVQQYMEKMLFVITNPNAQRKDLPKSLDNKCAEHILSVMNLKRFILWLISKEKYFFKFNKFEQDSNDADSNNDVADEEEIGQMTAEQLYEKLPDGSDWKHIMETFAQTAEQSVRKTQTKHHQLEIFKIKKEQHRYLLPLGIALFDSKEMISAQKLEKINEELCAKVEQVLNSAPTINVAIKDKSDTSNSSNNDNANAKQQKNSAYIDKIDIPKIKCDNVCAEAKKFDFGRLRGRIAKFETVFEPSLKTYIVTKIHVDLKNAATYKIPDDIDIAKKRTSTIALKTSDRNKGIDWNYIIDKNTGKIKNYTRIKFFDGNRYIWAHDDEKKAEYCFDYVANGCRHDVSKFQFASKNSLVDLINKMAFVDGAVTYGVNNKDWFHKPINMLACNFYNGALGLGSHTDWHWLFDRPIVTMKFVADCMLAFDSGGTKVGQTGMNAKYEVLCKIAWMCCLSS